jgi:membrane protease YdiL (CAAX protease family)
MADEKTLASYIEERVRAGASKQAITEQLTAVGWSEEDAESAYAAALVAVGVPVPMGSTAGQHLKKATTMDVVLNFFSFILLGVVATALGTLYFAIINHYFPDPLNVGYYYGRSSAVHYAIAALIIAFPFYYFVVRFWFKRFRDDSAKTESGLTKWVTYLVLLIASVTIVGDLIAVLFTFFQGEISARFFLKALTILGIAGAVFGFYFLERKKIQYKQDIPQKTFQLFGFALSGIVIVGIVLGFLVAGSPATERKRGFDEQRANDLNELSYCINGYAQEYQQLPTSVADLQKSTSYSYCANRRDPETGEQYNYAVVTPVTTVGNELSQGEYELCATFSLASDAGANTESPYVGYYDQASKWNSHGVGYECDTETVNIKKLPTVVY